MLYLTPDVEDVSVLGAECKRGGKPRPDGLVRRLQANRRPEIRVGRFARLFGGEAIGVVDRYASAAPASSSTVSPSLSSLLDSYRNWCVRSCCAVAAQG